MPEKNPKVERHTAIDCDRSFGRNESSDLLILKRAVKELGQGRLPPDVPVGVEQRIFSRERWAYEIGGARGGSYWNCISKDAIEIKKACRPGAG